ncbi:RsmE family RNA methyltransferase [Imperialibacter roseus]|uniref:Ribosomal RNA small subunit methyltransferase E n=1 Tax=Imperialibacter roseus TaxID=1324217 RepID=A0ABZ0IIA2_9BACT|nr:RsmE family RNA methyltransferase [Imperialibacter roseus]WOK04772.1 RsmE family RNA methyltransferase [Imperialibacter roseus]
MHIFYHPQKSSVNDIVTLDREESQHCLKVLRHKKGDQVYFTNGMGERFLCRIVNDQPGVAQLEVLSVESFSRPYHIHIAIAPTKQPDRIEWFLEKVCELGVDEITFVECEHSVRTKLKLERAEKITISALKQSKNFIKAKLNGLVKLDELIQTAQEGRQNFVAIADQPIENYLIAKVKKHSSYLILIGPEGDFSAAEIDQAISKGFLTVSLGESVLRTETAGIVACHLLHVANQIATP